VQIDLAALPDDPAVLQRMLQEVVPELQAENEKLWLLIQRLLRGGGVPYALVRCGYPVDPTPLAAAPRRSAGDVIHAAPE